MPLNQEQQAAVNSKSKKILCLAGAGTGKTHTMINRVSHLVDDEGISVARILVLTFTNAAAAEMEGRYRKTHSNSMAPKFGTFHAFCYSLIAENKGVRDALGYTATPHLVTEEDEKMIDKTIRQTLGLHISNNKLKGKGVMTKQDEFEYELYWKSFRKELSKRNLITFQIMCDDVCKLFEDNDECVDAVKQRYKYVFIDEFQDTDPVQWRFLQSFPEDTNIFIVGDVKQAIYAFRGADSSIIKSIAHDDEWEVIKLVQNYRSTNQICSFANGIGDKDPAYSIDLASTKSGDNVVIEYAELTPYNRDAMKAIFGYLEFTRCNNEDLAILVRTNAEVDMVCDILKQSKIPYTTNAKPTDAVNILRSCLSPEFELSWLSSLLSSDRYSDFIRIKSLNPDYSMPDFIQDFGKHWIISKRFSDISETLAVAKMSNLFPYQRVAQIMKLLNLPEHVIDCTSTNYVDIITYCLEIADGTSGITPKDDTKVTYVGTIHSSKGLEYDAVLLLGVGGKSFRLTNEENLNLYYVGCTRAKNHLRIAISE